MKRIAIRDIEPYGKNAHFIHSLLVFDYLYVDELAYKLKIIECYEAIKPEIEGDWVGKGFNELHQKELSNLEILTNRQKIRPINSFKLLQNQNPTRLKSVQDSTKNSLRTVFECICITAQELGVTAQHKSSNLYDDINILLDLIIEKFKPEIDSSICNFSSSNFEKASFIFSATAFFINISLCAMFKGIDNKNTYYFVQNIAGNLPRIITLEKENTILEVIYSYLPYPLLSRLSNIQLGEILNWLELPGNKLLKDTMLNYSNKNSEKFNSKNEILEELKILCKRYSTQKNWQLRKDKLYILSSIIGMLKNTLFKGFSMLRPTEIAESVSKMKREKYSSLISMHKAEGKEMAFLVNMYNDLFQQEEPFFEESIYEKSLDLDAVKLIELKAFFEKNNISTHHIKMMPKS